MFFFFFQAEDGIRDDLVTGVQTCALPISFSLGHPSARFFVMQLTASTYLDLQKLGLTHDPGRSVLDRKSTRLNSSHQIISYAVFCLKKKKKKNEYYKMKIYKIQINNK